MPKPEIEEFAKLLVTEVRDASIKGCDMLLDAGGTSPRAKRWSEKLSNASNEDLVRTVIPDCVDIALANLLRAIDQEVLRISFLASNGNVVDLTEEGMGELVGWYGGGAGGWVSKYSRQRFVDDFEDLEGLFDGDAEGGEQV